MTAVIKRITQVITMTESHDEVQPFSKHFQNLTGSCSKGYVKDKVILRLFNDTFPAAISVDWWSDCE